MRYRERSVSMQLSLMMLRMGSENACFRYHFFSALRTKDAFLQATAANSGVKCLNPKTVFTSAWQFSL